MPISGPSSYLPTTDEFIAHWTAVNTALGNDLILRGNIVIDQLTDLMDELDNARTELTAKLNQREFARGNLNAQIPPLLTRLEQFNAQVRVTYDGGEYVNALPKVPGPTVGEARILGPLEDAANIWGEINDGVNDLLLIGDYTLAMFTSALAALQDVYTAYNSAASDERIARGARNRIQDEIYPILKLYRQTVPTKFAEGSEYIVSLPRLTPLPGSTPDAVNASAIWDETEQKAKLVWDASDNANLKEYEIRYTPGSKYVEDDASVVANVLPGAALELLTLDGLTQPGATATYKVFVILETDNEAGSEAMSVTRPAGA